MRHTPSHRTAGLVLGAALMAMALIAGFFYAYACSVMPGLAQTDDPTFVGAMQQINDAVQNPVFFASFVGAPVLAAGAAVLQRSVRAETVTRWVVAAFALYAVAFVVTGAINVPLNDELARAGDRGEFEGSWVAWNIVRTVASTAAVGCLGYALVLHGREAAAPAAR